MCAGQSHNEPREHRQSVDGLRRVGHQTDKLTCKQAVVRKMISRPPRSSSTIVQPHRMDIWMGPVSVNRREDDSVACRRSSAVPRKRSDS